MSSRYCKYCRKKLVLPCETATGANACENGHPDIVYSDRPIQLRDIKPLVVPGLVDGDSLYISSGLKEKK